MTKGEAAKTLINFLSIKNQLRKADAIFILGNSSLSPVKKAAELYKKGLANKIFFTSYGGTFTNPAWKQGEAKKYHQTLRTLGVPEEDIFWTEATDNTLDEAKYAIKFMRKKKINPKTVILVSRPVHQRRAFATFARQNPDIDFINCPADEAYEMDKDLIERLVGEIERLKKYARKGDLQTQKIPKKVIEAAQFLAS